MRLLQLISLAQLLALIYLGLHVVAMDNQLSSIQALQEISIDIPRTQLGQTSNYSDDETERLSSMIRQLIVAQGAVATSETEASMGSTSERQPLKISSEAEVSAVDQSIEYYVSFGEISPSEMGRLQEKIVRLDENNKKEMFKKLFRALNSGRLKGLL